MQNYSGADQKPGLEMAQKPRLEMVFILLCFSYPEPPPWQGCSETQLQPQEPQTSLNYSLRVAAIHGPPRLFSTAEYDVSLWPFLTLCPSFPPHSP